MPANGGYAPQPERYGGRKPRLEAILDSLNEGRGTALDCSRGTIAWAENMAIARALTNVWDANECLSNQFNMLRVTSLLERWEKILGLVPDPATTVTERRTACAGRMALFGFAPLYQRLIDAINAIIAPVTATIEFTTPSTTGAVIYWPGGTPNTDYPWTSSVLYLCILLTKPSWMSEADFYVKAGEIGPLVRDWLPAWVTFDWVRDGSTLNEFILYATDSDPSEPANIDNQRMSVT